MNEKEKIFAEDQREYWFGDRMPLFLLKHPRFDISNATRKLSNANYGMNPAVFWKLLLVVMYVLNTKRNDLNLELTRSASKPWETICVGDSDCAGDPISRRSVYGFILYVLSVLVSW